MVETVRSFGKLASPTWATVMRAAVTCAVLVIALATGATAQSGIVAEVKAKIDALKGRIFDARMAQQMFANGLKYCGELNGKNFYFQLRNRVLNLEDYFQSLDNLVKAQVFNPDKHRPWTPEDAKERWEAVKKQAEEDKQKCELVANLSEYEKQLQELQRDTAVSEKKD
jgi:hypothetical protein